MNAPRTATPRSPMLRTQLALTYAGIALLTAALLGGILLSVLSSYYAQAEQSYLATAARRVLEGPLPGSAQPDAQQWVLRAAITAQARIRLYDADGQLMADSGPLTNLDPAQLMEPRDMHGRGRERLPQPLGEGLFGGESISTSSRSLHVTFTDAASGEPGSFTISEPPVSGRAVLIGIAQAWVLAAAFAVALAACAGYLLSKRISQPLAELTEASDRMAAGDLTTRAPVTRSDEFGRLAESFNAMAERVEATVVSLRRFIGDAAHQIGTPLTALEADLELAEKAAGSDDERRLVRRSLGQARRLEALSQGLLRLSRIEAGEDAELESIDLAAVVHEAVDSIASRAEQADLTLEVGEVAEKLVVTADRAKLQLILESLLDNAVKFTPAGGKICVAAVRDGEEAVLSVADTGVGIPLGEQEAVFSRFHRARNAAAIPGSGLGLAIVKATVERFGGTVAFTSDESGTRVEVRLPS